MDPQDLVRAGPIAVSPEYACAVWLHGRELDLSVRQIRMLALLVAARGRLVSRRDLYERATGATLPHGSRAVDKDMWRIRRALADYGRFLRSVRKVGYALRVDAFEGAAPEEAGAASS